MRCPLGGPRIATAVMATLLCVTLCGATSFAQEGRKCVTVVAAQPILCEKNEASISDEYKSVLQKWATLTAEAPEWSIVIHGACLTEELGRSMDTVRALAVKGYVLSLGMPDDGVAELHTIADEPSGLQPRGGSAAVYVQMCIDPSKRKK